MRESEKPNLMGEEVPSPWVFGIRETKPDARNDFGSHFVSLFVKGVYAYGQLLTELRRGD